MDVLNGREPIKITKIKSDNINIKNKIQEYTDYLHIKKYNNNNKILEFYINKEVNLDSKFEEFKKTNNIYFKDKYGDLSSYNIIEFIDIKDFNSYNILRFEANEI